MSNGVMSLYGHVYAYGYAVGISYANACGYAVGDTAVHTVLLSRAHQGKRVFITNVKGTFLGMSESEEASKRR
jgi:hypothetical protein